MSAGADSTDVIIVNYHGAADVLGALASIEMPACGTVHVVDNSVDAAQAEQLHQGIGAHPQVRLHIADENLGFGKACNWAFELSGAPTVLLLNPDARLRRGALQRLRQTLAERPRLAAVAPRIDWTAEGHLVLPNLSSQSPRARIEQALACRCAAWWPGGFAERGRRYARRTMRTMGGATPFAVEGLSGAVLLLRRAAVAQAGGGLFDPAYFMFFEDTDLGQRLTRAGWQMQVDPRARAWHAWHNRPEKAALMAQAERVYLQRYHRVADRIQRWLVPRLYADPWRGSVGPVAVLRSAQSARQQIGRFWAVTPLPMLHPAGVRADSVARELSDEEWELLDPGRWYFWCDHLGRPKAGAWRRFDVVKPAPDAEPAARAIPATA